MFVPGARPWLISGPADIKAAITALKADGSTVAAAQFVNPKYDFAADAADPVLRVDSVYFTTIFP